MLKSRINKRLRPSTRNTATRRRTLPPHNWKYGSGESDNGFEFAVFMTHEGQRRLRVTAPDRRVTFEDKG